MTMDLLAPPFTVGDFADGYAVREVDEFVLRVREALRRNPSTMNERDVEGACFSTVSGSRGYERRQVDAWLVAVAAELATRVGDGQDARLQFSPSYTFGFVDDDPPELRGVSAGAVGVQTEPTSAKTWVRVTAVLVLIALVACYGLSYL